MIEPIRGASFPCGEIPKYRKKAAKKTPKKADHKHEYERVILRYINSQLAFSPERGYISGEDFYPGRRCTICGRLERGFEDGIAPRVCMVINMRMNGVLIKRRLISEQYRHLPVVRIRNFWTLEKEEEKNGI